MEEEQDVEEPSPEKEMEVSVCTGGAEDIMARRYPSCVKSASKRSGISKGQLLKSYKRGIGAYKTNPGSVRNVRGVKGGPGPKMSKEQWACARVNKLARLKRRAGYDRDLL